MIAKTFKQLLDIDQEVAGMYQQNPDLIKQKFGYGYKRFHEKNITPTQKKLDESIDKPY